jgi:hypothetical protein
MKFILLIIFLFLNFVKILAKNDLIPYRDGSKWGFCDSSAKIIIKPKYDSVNVFIEDRALVYKNGFCGFIDKNGNNILSINNTGCKDYHKGIASAYNKSNQYFINYYGRNITNLNINSLDYHNGLVIVSNNSKSTILKGIIDTLGRTIFPMRFNEVGFICNLDTCITILLSKDSMYVLNYKNELVYLRYSFINGLGINSRFTIIDPYFTIEYKSKFGFINSNLKEIIPPKYIQAQGFYNDFGLVQRSNPQFTDVRSRTIAYVDSNGNELLIDDYIAGGFFNDGRALVLKVIDSSGVELHRYGFIDKTGNVVIPVKYCIYSCAGKLINWSYRNNYTHSYLTMWDDVLDNLFKLHKNGNNFDLFFWDAYDFHEGLARVWENGFAGYIDTSGKIVIKPQFEVAGYFKEGLAPIRINNKYGFINHLGFIDIEPKYSLVGYFNNGIAEVVFNRKKGYINKNGLEYFRN